MPTDAEIRDFARGWSPELTAAVGASGSAIPTVVSVRLPWVRRMAGLDAFGDDLLTAQGLLLVHRLSRDLAFTQGSSNAPIGPGLTGALGSESVGGMSLGMTAPAGFAPPGSAAADAELQLTAAGQAFLAMRSASAFCTVPFCG